MAAPRHIAKYISHYQSIYPDAQILLITNTIPDIILHWESHSKQIFPAVSHIRAIYDRAPNKRPRILLHLFSNGGAHQSCQVARAFKEKAGVPLPISAMVLDSTPGKGTYRRSANAILISLPISATLRLFGTIVVYSAPLLIHLYYIVTRKPNLVERLRQGLNDKDIFSQYAPRCYLYSKADEMVRWESVKEHAKEAGELGFKDVETIRFEYSPHARHIMEDAEKYWSAVKELWERAIQRSEMVQGKES